jgi:hypothetical protein
MLAVTKNRTPLRLFLGLNKSELLNKTPDVARAKRTDKLNGR